MTDLMSRPSAVPAVRGGAHSSGARKVAVVIAALGTETGARVLGHFSPHEVEAIIREVKDLSSVPVEEVSGLLARLHDEAIAQVYAVNGGLERARELLKRSHGGEADSILERIVAASAQTPFNFLRARRADQVVSLLSNEHPQIIALVLSHLPLGLAARVLEGLHDKTRADVATRYAMLDGADPEVVSEIEALLARRAGTSETTNTEARGGVKPLAQLLNSVARETEKGVLAEMERVDPTLAAEVRELMFVFDDLIHMDDRSLQEILRACDTRMIAMALKGAADDVRLKMEGNLSKRASEDIAELAGAMGNAKKADIDKAQSEIVKVARRMEESGAIVLVRGETSEG